MLMVGLDDTKGPFQCKWSCDYVNCQTNKFKWVLTSTTVLLLDFIEVVIEQLLRSRHDHPLRKLVQTAATYFENEVNIVFTWKLKV